MHSAHSARGGISFFHLAQNLRLADDHGIQAGRYAKHVADGFGFTIFVQVRLIAGRVKVKVVAQESTQVRAAVASLRQHFDPIAGAKDQAFIHAGMLAQVLQSVGQARFGNGQPLPHFDRRSVVVNPMS